MLKVRIIPTLLYDSPTLVKGAHFNNWRTVGSALQAVRVFNLRGVDELIFIDIAASQNKMMPDIGLVDELADECFMPLTVGGGISSVDHIGDLLRVGADKVVINSAAIDDSELIGRAANTFGSQCIVVGMDVKKTQTSGAYQVFSHCGTTLTTFDPIEYCKRAEDFGAGEMLITSIDRDGSMKGYDIDFIERVSREVSIPIIVSGGAGQPDHFFRAAQIPGVMGLAAGSIFFFTEHTPLTVREYLKENGISVRSS